MSKCIKITLDIHSIMLIQLCQKPFAIVISQSCDINTTSDKFDMITTKVTFAPSGSIAHTGPAV